MKSETTIKTTFVGRGLARLCAFAGATILSCFLTLGLASTIAAQNGAVASGGPATYATAEEAANALVAAAENYDKGALLQILGPGSYDIINSGEAAQDRETAGEFVALARKKTKITVDPRNRLRAILAIGDDDWPFPVPIVKKAGKWSFDINAGRQEILYRRIGRNELDAIAVNRGYVEAQHEYALTKHDDSKVNQYAQRLISSPGKQDGLAWQSPDGTWGGTVGERAAKEIQESYAGKPAPFHGYYFKILTGQGAAAQLGEMDFVVKGSMIGGFALLAFPAVYQVTGVKTFMVSHDGVVYEKDLGPQTTDLAKGIERFNPDATWLRVTDDK